MNTNAASDGKTVSFAQMNELIAGSPAGVYGFIVSQKVYDELKTQIPEGFAGGNSFANIPIVVDPDLSDGVCDVAFTAKGWRERLQKIRHR